MSASEPERSNIHLFGAQESPPNGGLSAFGEKGWGLARMSALGAPVPPGLMLPAHYSGETAKNGGRLTDAVRQALGEALSQLEEITGRRFGDEARPLRLSVRSSPRHGVPFRIDSVLNLGVSEKIAQSLGNATGDAAGDSTEGWDAYRRLIEGYGVQVLGLNNGGFEGVWNEAMESEGVEGGHQLSPEAMRALALEYREVVAAESGTPWPEDPMHQLYETVAAAYRAWNAEEAQNWRIDHGFEDLGGTGLVLQTMAGGTGQGQSGAGRLITRVPATGEKKPHGNFLFHALGPDLSAGIRITGHITDLEKADPEAYGRLLEWGERLENHFQDAMDIQFTIDNGTLALLSARPSQRTAKASLKIALDLVEAEICDRRQGLLRVNPAVIDEYLHPVLDKTDAGEPIAKGLPASPGSAVGHAVFFAEQAVDLAAQGIKTILIRNETTPEDIDGLKVAEGIITAHGGLTSHAAVVARGMGKCCIVGAGAIRINYLINELTVGEHQVQRMDWISMDGATGEIFAAELPQIQPALEGGIATVLEWADDVRRLGVYANADTAEDARHALEQGAGGIGLCRTEHMFFEIDRIPLFRKMILALDEIGRAAALAELLPLQRKDFMEIFRVMEDRPVTIRLLDPPLNEYLPKGIRSQTRMARAMGIAVETIQLRTEALSESNPMMGHRGCRLAITYPEIYNMQVRAIVEAACIVKKEGVQVNPEIMVPLVSTGRELSLLRADIEKMVTQVTGELGETIHFKIGTMVETPRAAVSARSIARLADFFSFGTNDLTQMSYGFSRDDVGMFLPVYLEKGILDNDPFMEFDQEGTGRLVKMAVEEGREANPDLKLGVCGEHGGDPRSVKFFHRLGLDYVSCSPFRIPVARLAAGQAMVESQAD